MNIRVALIRVLGAGVLTLGVTITTQAANPVRASADSAASGRKLYARHCSDCHGNTGKGDGIAGERVAQRPSNLADATRDYGSSDADIFDHP